MKGDLLKRDEKIITCLKLIQEGRDGSKNGAIINYFYPDELPKDYNTSNIDYYRELGILGKEGNTLHLTSLGYQTLNSAYSLETSKLSQKINKEMLNHTKIMKRFTMALFILTIINIILVGVQLFIND